MFIWITFVVVFVVVMFLAGIRVVRPTTLEETAHWGIDIVRTELKEIDPPSDVQDTMNKVVKAENEKVAAIDFATATETMADGARRAEIKKAEGIRQAKILEAEGEANAKIVIPANTELVNVIGEMAGILPFRKGNGSAKE